MTFNKVPVVVLRDVAAVYSNYTDISDAILMYFRFRGRLHVSPNGPGGARNASRM